MDRTQLILLVGGVLLALGLLMAMVLPWFALEDPDNASSAWGAGICGGFLVAMLGAIMLLTGVFRVYSSRRTEGQPPAAPPPDHECPHMPPPPPPEGDQGSPGDGAEGLK